MKGQEDIVFRCWVFNGMKQDQILLGLKWKIQTNRLCCFKGYQLTNNSEAVTKRKFFPAKTNIYDPIGFTDIALLLPKQPFQEAWCFKSD